MKLIQHISALFTGKARGNETTVDEGDTSVSAFFSRNDARNPAVTPSEGSTNSVGVLDCGLASSVHTGEYERAVLSAMPLTSRNTVYARMMVLPQLDETAACCECGGIFCLERVAKRCDGCRKLTCSDCVTRTRTLDSNVLRGALVIQRCACKSCANCFHWLPEDVLLRILCQLDPWELLQLEGVCKVFHCPRHLEQLHGYALQPSRLSVVEFIAQNQWGWQGNPTSSRLEEMAEDGLAPALAALDRELQGQAEDAEPTASSTEVAERVDTPVGASESPGEEAAPQTNDAEASHSDASFLQPCGDWRAHLALHPVYFPREGELEIVIRGRRRRRDLYELRQIIGAHGMLSIWEDHAGSARTATFQPLSTIEHVGMGPLPEYAESGRTPSFRTASMFHILVEEDVFSILPPAACKYEFDAFDERAAQLWVRSLAAAVGRAKAEQHKALAELQDGEDVGESNEGGDGEAREAA